MDCGWLLWAFYSSWNFLIQCHKCKHEHFVRLFFPVQLWTLERWRCPKQQSQHSEPLSKLHWFFSERKSFSCVGWSNSECPWEYYTVEREMCNTFFQLKCIEIFGKTRLTSDERFFVIRGGELLNCWKSTTYVGAGRELLARWKSTTCAYCESREAHPEGWAILYRRMWLKASRILPHLKVSTFSLCAETQPSRLRFTKLV